MTNRFIYFFLLLFFFNNIQSQQIKLVSSKPNLTIRGLSVVNDNVVWVSGSGGTVGKSRDGGDTWKWLAIKGFEKNEFRDIEAFDEMNAIVMSIGEPAFILRTVDGGENWNIVLKDTTKGMFLDAMEFWNDQSGIVIGDPINNHFFIARTFNGGRTWRGIPEYNLPKAQSGEACFAASGTNIRKLDKKEAIFVSGGSVSNLFIRNQKINIPIVQGVESKGANSIALKNRNIFIVVGGDFNAIYSSEKNCSITSDAGKTWHYPEIAPHGYRSSIEFIRKKEWITCGPNGVDYTKNEGKTFYLISSEGFHVCRKAKKGKAVFLAGGDGRVGKLE